MISLDSIVSSLFQSRITRQYPISIKSKYKGDQIIHLYLSLASIILHVHLPMPQVLGYALSLTKKQYNQIRYH